MDAEVEPAHPDADGDHDGRGHDVEAEPPVRELPGDERPEREVDHGRGRRVPAGKARRERAHLVRHEVGPRPVEADLQGERHRHPAHDGAN
jgi:hypothetical protein